MTAAIEIKNVSKWFGDFKALDDVSLATSQGEKVVICCLLYTSPSPRDRG